MGHYDVSNAQSASRCLLRPGYKISTVCAAVPTVLDCLFGRSLFSNRDDLDTHWHRGLAMLATDIFTEVNLFDHVAILNRYLSYKLTHRSPPERQRFIQDGQCINIAPKNPYNLIDSGAGRFARPLRRRLERSTIFTDIIHTDNLDKFSLYKQPLC